MFIIAEEIVPLRKIRKKNFREEYIELPLKIPVKPKKKVKISKIIKKQKIKPFLRLGDIDEQATNNLNIIIKQFKKDLDDRVKKKEFLLSRRLQAQIAKNKRILKSKEAIIKKESEKKLREKEKIFEKKLNKEFEKRLKEELNKEKLILDRKNKVLFKKLELQFRKKLNSELKNRFEKEYSQKQNKLEESFAKKESRLRSELADYQRMKENEIREKFDKIFEEKVKQELGIKVNAQFDDKLNTALANVLKPKEKELRDRLEGEYKKRLSYSEAKARAGYQKQLIQERTNLNNELKLTIIKKEKDYKIKENNIKEYFDTLFEKRIKQELGTRVNAQFDNKLNIELLNILKPKEKELREQLELEYKKKLANSEAKTRAEYQKQLIKEKTLLNNELESRESGMNLLVRETENRYKEQINALETEKRRLETDLNEKRIKLEQEYTTKKQELENNLSSEREKIRKEHETKLIEMEMFKEDLNANFKEKKRSLEQQYNTQQTKLEENYKNKEIELEKIRMNLKERESKLSNIIKQRLAKKHQALMNDFDKTIKQRYDEIENVLNTLRNKVDKEIKQDIDSEFETIKNRVKQEMTAYSKQFKEEKQKIKKKSWFKF